MRDLNLHTKITILILVVVVAVFATLFSLYDKVTLQLAREQQQRRSELLAVQLSEVIEVERGGNIGGLRSAIRQFKKTHPDVTEIHLYGLGKAGLQEVVSYPEISRPLPAKVVAAIEAEQTYSHLDFTLAPQIRVLAAAPVLNAGKFNGIVILDLEYNEDTGLVQDLNRMVLLLLASGLLLITFLIYILFRTLIYKPLNLLVSAMHKVKEGNLEVSTHARTDDEIGQLSKGFNSMVAHLRVMSTEQKAHKQELENRVQEATLELAERNEQLEAAHSQLFEMQRKLTQLERLAAAGQLAAQFAHEVGTPLNLISGHVQLLSAQLTDEKASIRLEIIAKQIVRIEKIVRHMLDSTRRPPAEMRNLNINLLLKTIVEAIQPTLSSRNVEIVTEFEPNLPDIKGDPEQLQQVFLNLVNNSIDAMPEGGTLYFSSAVVGELVVIGFEDTGHGIPENARQKIFEPMFTTKKRGTGLGLFLARQIIEEHNGLLELCSNAGAGTRFTIQLPLAIPKKENCA